MSVLFKPYCHDEEKSFKCLESILWNGGVLCTRCGNKCSDCSKQSIVKVGIVFEQAHIALNKILQAVYLMRCRKKVMSAHQLRRILEISYKSVWFLGHRIHEAMHSGDLAPMGGSSESLTGKPLTYRQPNSEMTAQS